MVINRNLRTNTINGLFLTEVWEVEVAAELEGLICFTRLVTQAK